MPIRDRPLFTEIFEQVDQFVPEPGAVYLFGTSAEERSAHSREWEAQTRDVLFARVISEGDDDFVMEVKGSESRVPLRSGSQLRQVWVNADRDVAYLDITGLGHHVWAPLLKAAFELGKPIRAVYVEPYDYRFSSAPTEGEIFDLSERIRGIRPLPGFVSLAEAPDDQVCFVPLLGFEGTRLSHLLETVQPGGRVIPIVGVPGFRPEYPFHAYHGNRSPLVETRAWRDVRFALANCPFSLFYTLQDIAAEHSDERLKVAPIGTKPHALGAILFCLISREPVEVVYDHPIRKPTRTTGAARLLVYHLSAFSSRRT